MASLVLVVKDPTPDNIAKAVKAGNHYKATKYGEPFMNKATLKRYGFKNLYGKQVELDDKLKDSEIKFELPSA